MTKNNKKRVCVLISGSGSNLQALIDAARADDYPATIVKVISNRSDAYGLQRAEQANIPTEVIDHRNFEGRVSFDQALDKSIKDADTDLVCLAGFMRLLTPEFVEKWHDRMLNIHPSLLPSFPGLNTHARALKEGVRFSGCTVHMVRPEMDTGPIILQGAVPVAMNDTADTLAARVLETEHKIYPTALRWIAEGTAMVEKDRIIIKNVYPKPPQPLIWPNLD